LSTSSVNNPLEEPMKKKTKRNLLIVGAAAIGWHFYRSR
jgi:hypothetical protein